MAGAVDIAVNIVTKFTDDGLDEASGKFGKVQSGVSKAAKVSAVALVALGGAAIAAASAAAEDQQAQALLANTLEKSAGATAGQITATEDWIGAMSKATGVADDELRPALGTLVRATGDVEKSQKALKVAMDVSAATGKPLASVSAALSKGFAGSTASIGKLVPGLDAATLASGDMDKIMGALADKTGGAMAASADTAAGKMAIMQNNFAEAKESLGAGLLPIMTKFAGVLATVATWIGENSTLFGIIAGVIATVAAGIIVLNAAIKTATVLQAAYNLVMLANPAVLIIVAIIAAVALLVAAFVIAWKNSETFRNVVTAALEAVKKAALAVYEWLKEAFTKIWAILEKPVMLYVAYIKLQFKIISTIIETAIDVIVKVVTVAWDVLSAVIETYAKLVKTVWSAIFDAISTVMDKIRDVVKAVWDKVGEWAETAKTKVIAAFQAVADKVTAIFNGIKSAITSSLNSLIGIVNNLINAYNKIPGAPNIPNVPGVGASSYAVTGPAAGVRGTSLFSSPRVPSMRTARAAGAGGVVINVTGAMDPEAVARQVRRLLSDSDRRNARVRTT